MNKFDRASFVALKDCSELEAMFIEPLLESANIPFYRVEPGTGNYLRLYMGAAPSAIRLYVPVDCYEQAKDIVTFISEQETEEEVEEKPQHGSRLHAIRGLAALFLLVLYFSDALPGAMYMMKDVLAHFREDAGIETEYFPVQADPGLEFSDDSEEIYGEEYAEESNDGTYEIDFRSIPQLVEPEQADIPIKLRP
ncbi:hypothetical protein FHS18_000701 [Paenibacillus phyllosphaerae]|uniref:DUF2007 domain-containing protein n=1 Tax=Paenibacillus phyllosphaerae TaxID=274593 RepID=A0A7W5FL39_9BACL|nr:hypothetical protein [Paenibacillus phyllosphaerae]